MSEPTISQLLEMLNNKLETDLSNAPAAFAFIKKVTENEFGTCIEFTNGFKVMFGYYEVSANASSPKLVTFPDPFTRDDYYFGVTPVYNGDLTLQYIEEYPNTRSLRSVQVSYTGNKARWLAVGF